MNKDMVTEMIVGKFATRTVTINYVDDGRPHILNPAYSQKFHNHSPDGFNWGYGGSGPAQLALALLLKFTDQEIALSLYQPFKRDVIAKLPQADFTLPIQSVLDWVEEHKKEAI